MKYYVISGETSGDMHSAAVMQKLHTLDSEASFRGMGGDASEAAGMHLVLHQREMAIMGFWEVVKNLRKISKTLRRIKGDIEAWKPDAVLLVDYPGFNLKIARFAKGLGIPVHYYIAPKVWAWKESRVKQLQRYVDQLYSILPFEEEYFSTRGVNTRYVGNPSKEAVDRYVAAKSQPLDLRNGIGLLPGSRKQEIETSFPIMLEVARKLSLRIVVAQAPGFNRDFYLRYGDDFTLIPNDMYGLLNQCKLAFVTSGTATLETALMQVPQVVCYRMNGITFQIAKLLVKLKYFSLANLVLGEACIPELIQHDFNTERLMKEAMQLISDGPARRMQLEKYANLDRIIGNTIPSDRVATLIHRATAIDQ